jgi:hypothetical protein
MAPEWLTILATVSLVAGGACALIIVGGASRHAADYVTLCRLARCGANPNAQFRCPHVLRPKINPNEATRNAV